MMPASPAEWQRLESRLRRHVETLAATTRVPGKPDHARAAAYIRQHLREAGLTVTDDAFEDGGHPGVNIRARRGADGARPLVVIGAHYDSIPTSVGADDNASAVAALLEIARSLPSAAWEASGCGLELVAYDLEEYGLGGSRRHAREFALAASRFGA